MSRRFSPEELASCRCKPEQIAGLAFAADCPLHGSARYEDIAPRLAGEATEQAGGTARWNAGKERSDGTAQVYAPSYGPLRRVVPIAETSAVCAALIAYHHPARVLALAAVVRAARGIDAEAIILAAREESYGVSLVDDPRMFTPDPECSTEEERAQHRADCEAWERGERPERNHRCELTDGRIHSACATPWGLGVSIIEPAWADDFRRLAADLTEALRRLDEEA